MSVAIYLNDIKEADSLIPWGAGFAHSRHSDLIVVMPKRSKGKVAWNELESISDTENENQKKICELIRGLDREHFVLKQDIAQGRESSNLDRAAISVIELQSPTPEHSFAESVSEQGIKLVLVQADEPGKSTGGDSSRVQQLFEQVPCETVLIRGACPSSDKPIRIMLATDGESDLHPGLDRARQLASTFNGIVTILYVRPDDDMVAADVAARNLKRLLKFDTDYDDLFERKIELADSLLEGARRQNLDEFDLVIVGSNKAKTRRQMFRELEDTPESEFTTAVAAFRSGVPMASRMWSHVLALVRGTVPQLEREQRIELVKGITTGSQFNFDFVALISLSTIIAGLGLIDNSTAVVIGAMLVAPLMNPLVGIGFSLIQGNGVLIMNATKSVLLGFAVAFVISVLLGLLNPGIVHDGHMNTELSSRCNPNLLHLMVALVSGIAGAYATGRPGLPGALPGVAIAAALVPPIATSGIALAIGEFELSFGALLLFFTNIVAIVLGSTIVFWAMGLNPQAMNFSGSGSKPRRWPGLLFILFVVISFLLAIFFSIETLQKVIAAWKAAL